MKTLKNIGIALFGTFTLISCGGDDMPPVNPELANVAPVNTYSLEVRDLTGDGKLNDLVVKHTATDSDGTIDFKEAILNMGSTEIASFNNNAEHGCYLWRDYLG